MGYKIKAIRLAIKAAKACLKKMIKDVEKSSVIAVLEDIDATLGSLGLDYVVTMEEFANAAVRVLGDTIGTSVARGIGIAVYHLMETLLL